MTAALDARIVLRVSEEFLVDVDLSVDSETTVALLGPNGAGKSTVVSVIAGLMAVDDGTITIGGSIVDDPRTATFVPPERRNVGVVFQDYLLFAHMSVLENVAFGLRSKGLIRSAREERARAWLERLGLANLAQKRPGDLSGGERQRVALARALAPEPDVLLLDEPLAALDVTTKSGLRHILQDYLEEFAGPRLLITHDPADASLLADEICILESGSITQRGTAEELRMHPRSPYAADLVGSNLLAGVARDGGVVLVGDHEIHVADELDGGPVLVTIPANAISVHGSRPSGSQRNIWETTIERVEPLGARVRLLTGPPLQLAVEVTRSARDDLALEPGSRVWVAVKATEASVIPDVG